MMITSAVVLYLLLLSHQTVSEEQVQQFVIGEKGNNTTLHCLDHPVNASSVLYQWKKDGAVVATQNPPNPSVHLSISENGFLRISGLQLIDEGLYECESQAKGGRSWQTLSKIQLTIAAGPTGVSLDISPATFLNNGTLFVHKGSNVNFSCSSESNPSQNLTWTVDNLASDNPEREFGSKSPLAFSITNIQPLDQGTYTCTSQNTLSRRTANKTQELLVYYAPERHPECSWELGDKPSDVLFICSWFGGYPVPTLTWQEVEGAAEGPTINLTTSQQTEELNVSVNRSILHDGDKVKCTGHHVTGVEKSCSFTLKIPYPTGQPLATALEGTNITISCTETSSLPPAKTVWKKNDDLIENTSKYIVQENRPALTLTIVNVTKADEGVYYCYSENPLGARELEVYLNVKTSAGNGGAIVGIFVSVLVMMIGIVVGVTVYTKRDRICIGLRFSQLDDDRVDVLSLVDSDEEEIFHEAVPRLPPVTNGHATTLVEIHRIPSCDHEDIADSTEQSDQTRANLTEAGPQRAELQPAV
ncbi:V-set and immunoglobulin domain-containing protein 10 precursor [Danio rerio]|uniref:V-set and immunoglobulin domain-containing protein 10 n=1 Tax=Danio rerio TaxID=7955 RepID=VSI10_DANRE|nr:V-set and immunoglobulin domain-containing protein 10 precursor [Danio rerio]B0CLX4.1 RecName: Full=V-set and immunoglobulin domain-containing protein 10; Flags: Precursor [Danio rerio]CAP71919.1 si:ch73-13b6.3 [Danio rerio]|eukprot:NP_001093564.2 V-set and immunoglobulin domain-containing protein 10 precursor [Danio rerio]